VKIEFTNTIFEERSDRKAEETAKENRRP